MKYFISRQQSNFIKQAEKSSQSGIPADPKQIGGMPALVCKTGAGGIPARSGTVAGKATDIVVQRIEPDGTMSDTTRELTVYNPFAMPISSSVYITCKFVNNGYWIVDAEDCS